MVYIRTTNHPYMRLPDFVEDLRIYYREGVRYKADFALRFGISKKTFCRRITRARAAGYLKPGKTCNEFVIEFID